MTSPEMHTLSGAYALDALDDIERERFRRHLRECASCAQEVRELRATAARLGGAAAVDPPEEFRARVLAEVRTTRQDPPDAGPAPHEGRSRRDRVVPRWMVGVAAAAATAGLVLGGVATGVAWNANDELSVAQQQLEDARSRYSPVADLLEAPDARTAQGDAAPGGSGMVVASQEQNRLMFLGAGMPAKPAGKDYQLWLMNPDGEPRSAGIVGEDESPLVLADGIHGMARVALTVEPQGGSPQPTTAPIMVLGLPV